MTNHYGIYGVHTQQPLVRYGRRVSAAINVPIRRQRRRQRIDCAVALYMNRGRLKTRDWKTRDRLKGGGKRGTKIKIQGWKTQDWKTRDHHSGGGKRDQ